MLDGFLRCEEQAENIDVKMFVKLLLGDLFQRREFVNSGVVDQNIDLAEGLRRSREEAFDFRLLCNVGLDRNRLSAAF